MRYPKFKNKNINKINKELNNNKIKKYEIFNLGIFYIMILIILIIKIQIISIFKYIHSKSPQKIKFYYRYDYLEDWANPIELISDIANKKMKTLLCIYVAQMYKEIIFEDLERKSF